jgi:hypothetical protein
MVNKHMAKFAPELPGVEVVESLKKAEGGSWKGTTLPRNPEELSRMRSEFQIVAWSDGKGYQYPKWQFKRSSGGFLPGIQEILQILKSSDEWRVMRYFLDHREMLEGRILDLLRAGKVNEAIAHARLNFAQNTW